MGGVGRRENEYKLSLEVIVDCGNVVTQSSEGRKDKETPKGGRVALPMALAGPSVTPALCQAWLDWP